MITDSENAILPDLWIIEEVYLLQMLFPWSTRSLRDMVIQVTQHGTATVTQLPVRYIDSETPGKTVFWTKSGTFGNSLYTKGGYDYTYTKQLSDGTKRTFLQSRRY